MVYRLSLDHHNDVVMGTMASQITGVSIVCLTVCSEADQSKHQSPASLAFVRGIYRWPVYFPHKGPVTRKMLPFDDAVMSTKIWFLCTTSIYLTEPMVEMTVITWWDPRWPGNIIKTDKEDYVDYWVFFTWFWVFVMFNAEWWNLNITPPIQLCTLLQIMRPILQRRLNRFISHNC